MLLLRQQSGGNGRWHVNPFLQRTSSGMWEEDRLLQEEEEEYLDVSIRSPARKAIIPLCCQKRHNDREGIYFERRMVSLAPQAMAFFSQKK